MIRLLTKLHHWTPSMRRVCSFTIITLHSMDDEFDNHILLHYGSLCDSLLDCQTDLEPTRVRLGPYKSRINKFQIVRQPCNLPQANWEQLSRFKLTVNPRWALIAFTLSAEVDCGWPTDTLRDINFSSEAISAHIARWRLHLGSADTTQDICKPRYRWGCHTRVWSFGCHPATFFCATFNNFECRWTKTLHCRRSKLKTRSRWVSQLYLSRKPIGRGFVLSGWRSTETRGSLYEATLENWSKVFQEGMF